MDTVKCVECKKNKNVDEEEDYGGLCEFCEKIYLCEECGKNDKILYHYFVEETMWHSDICKPCFEKL